MLIRRLSLWALIQCALGASLIWMIHDPFNISVTLPAILIAIVLVVFGYRIVRCHRQWLMVVSSNQSITPTWTGMNWIEIGLVALMLFGAGHISVLLSSVLILLAIVMGIWIMTEYIRWRTLIQFTAITANLRIHEAEREHMDALFREIRSQRHDFLLHVGVLQQLLHNEKWKEATTYAQQLMEDCQTTNEHIKGECTAIAAFLDATYQKAASHGIAVSYQLDIPFSSIPLPVTEQVRLVGNLLNNALDAATESIDKTLTMKTSSRSGLFILEVSNSTPTIPSEVVDTLFQSYGVTTKQGDHKGLGTYVIHQIVKKYLGLLDFRYEGLFFSIKIKLPMIQTEGSSPP